MIINSVAVFCGSRAGYNPLYAVHAAELGKLLSEQQITIVYGGGHVGMMGTIADAAMKNEGKVIGIIPQILVEWEQQHKGISELTVVENMHVRKRTIYEQSDAVIILPGGNGTLDELFEVITWNALKIHHKKVLVLNTANFYNHLLEHLNFMQLEGFLYDGWNENFIVCATPAEIMSSLMPE